MGASPATAITEETTFIAITLLAMTNNDHSPQVSHMIRDINCHRCPEMRQTQRYGNLMIRTG
jgi:hypothetical protein